MKQAKISFLTFIVFFFLLVGGTLLLNYYKNEFIDNVEITNAEPYDLSAGTGDNVYGWAWNDVIGWISFNSANCDLDENGFIDTGYCGGDNATTAVVPYGVTVTNSGGIEGYAWSEVYGYIGFDYPGASFDARGTANLDIATREVNGWARICAMAKFPATCKGDDGDNKGWIAMSATDGSYGVTLDKDNLFRGYAWNDEIGWISFGSVNCDADRDGWGDGGDCPDATVAIPDYRVGMVTNVSGYAWNGDYGWFSLNCANSGAGGCGRSFYGVNMVDDEIFGYAWNSALGWVCFGETCQSSTASIKVCSNDSDITCIDSADCGGNPCDFWRPATDPDSNPVSISFSDPDLVGFANILSLGNDGWVRFDDDNISGDASDLSDYGVSIDASGDLNGYAWNGSGDTSPPDGILDDGTSWISFNCNEGDVDGGSVCVGAGGSSESDYKVSYSDYFSNNPQVANLRAPNWSPVDACYTGFDTALGARLKWDFVDLDVGAFATAYQLVIRKTDGTVVLDTGKCIDDDVCAVEVPPCKPADCIIDLDTAPYTSGQTMTYDLYANKQDDDLGINILEHGESYRWEVTVWDDNGVPSTPTAYSGDGDGEDTDNDDTVVDTFTVYDDDFPNPELFASPVSKPSAGETALFSSLDMAKYHSGSTEIGCDKDHCAWNWYLISGAGTVLSPTASSTGIQFDDEGDYEIGLTVTDNNNNSCSTSTSFSTKPPLPSWTEGN